MLKMLKLKEWEDCTRSLRRTWIGLNVGIVPLIILFPLVSSQNFPGTSGYISIDCGGAGGLDGITDLKWVADDPLDSPYLESAKALIDDSISMTTKVELNFSSGPVDNQQQMSSARVFLPGPKARPKYCYNLPADHNDTYIFTYLLRAMFPSAKLTATDKSGKVLRLSQLFSTRFYFTVDSTFVKTVELDPDRPTSIELVLTSMDESVYVCLVPLEDRSSMPAISTLELRPLSEGMYARGGPIQPMTSTEDNSVKATTYLLNIGRVNCGGDTQRPAVRYPSDLYDRLWYSSDSHFQVSRVTSIRNTTAVDVRSSGWFDNIPAEIMHTAWEGDNFTISFNVSMARASHPMPTFFLVMYFQELTARNAGGQRFMDVLLSNAFGANYKWISDLAVTQITQRLSSNHMPFFTEIATFGFIRNASSTLPALVNAIELYGEFEAATQRTLTSDAEAIINFANRAVAASYMLDTTGDPCLPAPWDWIICSIEIPPRITQVNLTGMGMKGDLPMDFGNLDRLTILDLSNNQFQGSLPESFMMVNSIRDWNLARNNLSGSLPKFEMNSLQHVQNLSFRNNRFTGELSLLVNALNGPTLNLDLSGNVFTGPIPPKIGELTDLQNLDLSENQLTGGVTFSLKNFTSLTTLNLANNLLSGAVPDSIWTQNSSLQNVYLNDNIFEVLDLTSWYQAVLKEKSLDAFPVKVRLMGNRIRTIIPSSIDLSIIPRPSKAALNIQMRTSPVSFILLGDNPWCSQQLDGNSTLAQRYLCRNNEMENFWYPSGNGGSGLGWKNLLVIVLIFAIIALVLICLFLVTFWRMWKRMRDLRQIQAALAKEDVRPPFYDYEELKAATKDFVKDHELGHGAFGAVYKAVLPDGSTVAVKKLFATEQNVADFLKETVLISGIKHKHLIQLKGCCVRDKQRILVYEYADNKNLAEALWGEDMTHVLDWTQRLNICLGIARGLAYLHEELHPKIIHRDIKPQNILLDKNLNAKIADFGLARPAHEDHTMMATQLAGTLGYFSPEYATLGMFTEKLDVYSYGVLVLEIVAGRKCINFALPPDEVYLRNWAIKLYTEERLAELLCKDLTGTCPLEEVELVIKMALLCLSEDPNRRPTMSQVVIMLVGKGEVAVDIMRELQNQKPSFHEEALMHFNKKQRENGLLSEADSKMRLMQSASDPSTSTQENILRVPSVKPR